MKQAVILAGGKGTRLKERLGDLPKPLVSVLGIPLLERQILSLKAEGISDVIILVNHKADAIIRFCNEKENWGIKLNCIDDGEVPRGTAGAVLSILNQLDELFLVVYGDTLFNIDFVRFFRFHEAGINIAASLFLHPNDHPADSDLVEMDDELNIVNFHGYPHKHDIYLPNLVNAALYIINRNSIISWRDHQGSLDFAKDLFPMMRAKGFILRGYVSPEYIKDAGTPRRLDKVELDLQNGKVERASFKYQQKAVFIDRDGTLNIEKGYITRPDQLELFPGVGEGLAQLNKFEWRSILVTNQPVIARGDCTRDELNKIHWKLENLIADSGAFIDKIYYCPHHPDRGFQNEVGNLKIVCSCRKPETGMFDKAMADLNIDYLNSWIIGDSTADLGAAHRTEISSILVETGNAGLDDKYPYTSDFVLSDFKAAVDFITKDYDLLVNSYKSYFEEFNKNRHWFVGGLSKSGKSTFAATCKRELRKMGQNCVVISLDRWLLDLDKRGQTVLDRYDLSAISDIYFRINKGIDELQVKLPFYSRRKKNRTNLELTQTIGPKDIIIWEGVVAFELAKSLNQQEFTFFIEVAEGIRKSRMQREYTVRGVQEQEFNEIYELREKTEHSIIKENKVNSRHIIN